MAPTRAGTTFPVDDVPAGPVRSLGIAAHRALENLMGRRGPVIEACEPAEGRLLPCGFHGFAAAVHLAYSTHVPLSIAPDHVWLVIAQGLAAHIHLDPQRWCGRMAGHPGRPPLDVHLEVREDRIGRDAPADAWAEVWNGFTELLSRECPDVVGLLAGHFSTTGLRERLAYAVTAMDVFEPFFQYQVIPVRGIPAITLEGNRADWLAVRERAERLQVFGLDWWLDALLPVLDRFVAASAGEVDVAWWRSFYVDEEASGGPYITGHIRAFFPYVCLREQKVPRRIVRQPSSRPGRDSGSVLTSEVLPSGLSRAPFTWRCRNADVPMEVVAGFVGIREGLGAPVFRPEIGWAVRGSERAAHLSAGASTGARRASLGRSPSNASSVIRDTRRMNDGRASGFAR